MMPDPTDEIRQIKHRLAAEYGNDLHRIVEETRRRQRESGRESVAVPKRQVVVGSETEESSQNSTTVGR